ncbi:MAG: hypothetical protein MdMp014T_2866 [Treponematales bacterium]
MNAAMQIRTNDIPAGLVQTLKNTFRGQTVVVLPEAEYREMAKAKRNAEYLAGIDKAARDIEEGRGVVKTLEELEALADA